MKTIALTKTFFVLGTGLLMTGCAHMEKFASHADMAVTRLVERGKPTYEGKLVASERIGAMTSLHFDDGKLLDVEEAPEGLQHGDVVRIYKTDKGLVAHLWQRGA